MTGASPWSLEDLARVAALFGESLADVVAPAQTQTSVPGFMSVGTARLACQLWLGGVADTPNPDAVVAVKTAAGWAALTASEAEGVVYTIERLEAKPGATARKVVAVLDDDQDLTNLDLRPLRSQRLRRAAVLQDRRSAIERRRSALRRLRHRLDRGRDKHAEADRIAAGKGPEVSDRRPHRSGADRRRRRGRHRRSGQAVRPGVQRETGSHVDPRGDVDARVRRVLRPRLAVAAVIGTSSTTGASSL